jgi:hypothetical protein
MRVIVTRWRLLAASVVIAAGLILGYTVAQVIEQDREVTNLVHGRRHTWLTRLKISA